jgi:tetratricopeptide (TPR) repeat protein
MHDLIRLYAAELGATDGPAAELAFGPVVSCYRRDTSAAAGRFSALPGQVVPAGFDTRDQAVAWFEAERATVVAIVSRAVGRAGCQAAAVDIALDFARFLERVRYLDDWTATATAATQAARELGDRHREGGALTNLGAALREVRRFDEAITAHQQARDLFSELGDRHGEGNALNNLGLDLRAVRRFEEAITAHPAGSPSSTTGTVKAPR